MQILMIKIISLFSFVAKEKIEIIQIRLEKQTETRKECIQKIEKLVCVNRAVCKYFH
jgi:hypothetical protein